MTQWPASSFLEYMYHVLEVITCRKSRGGHTMLNWVIKSRLISLPLSLEERRREEPPGSGVRVFQRPTYIRARTGQALRTLLGRRANKLEGNDVALPGLLTCKRAHRDERKAERGFHFEKGDGTTAGIQ